MQAAQGLGRPVEKEAASLMAQYLEQLVKWNRKMNLVGPGTWDTIFETLVVDSLFLADFLEGLTLKEKPVVLDLGAGAGLPGIPLRTLWREGIYWLVEVREKRALFMRSVLGRLKLEGTTVFHGKAEEVLSRLAPSGHDATADLILSKGFMPWPQLLDFVLPMVCAKGTLVILSNESAPKEEELPEPWELSKVTSYPVAGKAHYFWALNKV